MTLSLLDWFAVLGYLFVTVLLGFWFRKRSARSVDDYFVSGRNVNWWLAGTSMVATTFAADTPLVVTGLVYSQGISGNWLWWGSLLSGMMTVFLFARLWRRSGLLTDVQFAEILPRSVPLRSIATSSPASNATLTPSISASVLRSPSPNNFGAPFKPLPLA